LWDTQLPIIKNCEKMWLLDPTRLVGLNLLLMTVAGAAGGHKTWGADQRHRFMTGQLYQLVTSFGMYVAGNSSNKTVVKYCVPLFMVGSLFFVMPLYYRAWTDKPLAFGLGPVGGIATMLGFLGIFLL
jgi:uncharacterized membrane protein YgdD (TMEM256/DUF423 family)